MGALSLDLFHPLLKAWFEATLGSPTPVQAAAWPPIARGEHVLVTAPTGSGKTLTAFLWALDRLLTGVWEPGRVRVLYISPLRALNTDIRRNLLGPLAELTERFAAADQPAPAIRVMTRSGDTPQSERQKMLRRPPEILITTPESLAILLTSKRGRGLFGGLETVILDEIHAVAASKRGTHLITAVDRLVPLAGDVQRLALSATVEPLDRIAAFVGGYLRQETAGAVRFVPRPVRTVRAESSKRYAIEVRCPWADGVAETPPPEADEEGIGIGEPPDEGRKDDAVWQRLADTVAERIRANRSTLVFANSRRATEKLTHLINEGSPRPVAYAHHGSLSREVRTEVERRLKRGDLAAIVATNSLELGIDIGSLDEVVMVGTPPSVSSSVQRVGRAGHGVGETSHGLFLPVHPRDVLDAAVAASGVLAHQVEAIQPVEMPLDVLAQVILSVVAFEPWTIDDLFDLMRTSWPYRNLKRRQLDLVLDMLAGRYADTRIRTLRPRVTVDGLTGTVRARPGVARLVFQSGGTIPDRGYYALRLADSRTKLGELDEEFVWERSVGDTFALGTQTWQIRSINHNDVLVAHRGGGRAMTPFWRADVRDRDFAFAERVGRFLAHAEPRLGDQGFAAELREGHALAADASKALIAFLRDQHAATGCLPHRRRLVIEHVADARGDGRAEPMVLHTGWGGRVNRPFAMALEAAWKERYATDLETEVDDMGVLLRPPHAADSGEVLGLVTPERLEGLLRARLQGTGFFGAHFRANAQIALLLPRAGFRHRTPLWLSRQRAKKLLATVTEHEDFPIVVETWRSCLLDAFDLESLRQVLGELADGQIEVVEARTSVPSPFASGLSWSETNRLMYDDDTPEKGSGSKVRPDLLSELVFAAHLRPRLSADLVAGFETKIKRLAPGYAPRPGDDLADWIAEVLLIPRKEWSALVAAVASDHAGDLPEADLGAVAVSVADRAITVRLPGAERASVTTPEAAARMARALVCPLAELDPQPLSEASGNAPEAIRARLAEAAKQEVEKTDPEAGNGPMAEVVAHWLRYRGPVLRAVLGQTFGLDEESLDAVLEQLEADRTIVIDPLTEGAAEAEICDAENLERLLRWLRRSRRQDAEIRPARLLPLFLADHQGLTGPGSGVEDLEARLAQLAGWSARAGAWETTILPARLEPYYPAWLDALMQQSEVAWLGTGREKLTFHYPGDRELLAEASASERNHDDDTSPEDDGLDLERLFPDTRGRYPLEALLVGCDLGREALVQGLWHEAWRGRVTNECFLAVRQAVTRRFRNASDVARAAAPSALRGHRRSLRAPIRRRGTRTDPGTWRRLAAVAPTADALDRELLAKERARLVLDRYGIVFRQLLQRELPALRWSRVFRALRLMELSGEVLAGRFFDGVDGPQFLSLAAWRHLRRGLPEDAIFTLAADDPAAATSLGLRGLGDLPARRPSTQLVYHGSTLVAVATRSGRDLDIHVPPDHPRLADYLGALGKPLVRAVDPVASITVETILGEPAAKSPYAKAFEAMFRVVREAGPIRLWKRFQH